MSKLRASLPTILVIVAAIFIDQMVKLRVEDTMAYGEQIEILPFLALYRTHNTGIAFSLLSGLHDKALVAFTLVIVGFVIYLWWTTAQTRVFARVGFALIIGGALGNLIDRSMLGYVVDYVLFHLPNWSFAIFNLADVFITIGAGLILLQEYLNWKQEKTAKK
ncbi:signal peptidase II [Paenochrobactrum sp. BZR 588]|uniref:signal peptidase II n=1 Tax=unclassified Paenochrobactrum TaxID=2639760 RepID=UPI003853DB47